MGTVKAYKIIALILTAISLILTAVVYINIVTFIEIAEATNPVTILFPVVLIFLFSITICFLFFRLALIKQKVVTVYKEKKNIEKSTREEEEIEKQNIENTKKIEEQMQLIFSNLNLGEINDAFFEKLLISISKAFEIVQGLAYRRSENNVFMPVARYAYYSDKELKGFEAGEGISGQVAKDKKMLNIRNVPEGYITVLSGLGKSNPQHLLVLPILKNAETEIIIELASFIPFDRFAEDTFRSLGIEITKILEMQ